MWSTHRLGLPSESRTKKVLCITKFTDSVVYSRGGLVYHKIPCANQTSPLPAFSHLDRHTDYLRTPLAPQRPWRCCTRVLDTSDVREKTATESVRVVDRKKSKDRFFFTGEVEPTFNFDTRQIHFSHTDTTRLARVHKRRTFHIPHERTRGGETAYGDGRPDPVAGPQCGQALCHKHLDNTNPPPGR